jgi:hypothetical protein
MYTNILFYGSNAYTVYFLLSKLRLEAEYRNMFNRAKQRFRRMEQRFFKYPGYSSSSLNYVCGEDH